MPRQILRNPMVPGSIQMAYSMAKQNTCTKRSAGETINLGYKRFKLPLLFLISIVSDKALFLKKIICYLSSGFSFS